MTIKEAFGKLAISLSASMKNPFFIGRRLYQDFADIAENIEEGGSGSTHEYSTEEHVVGKWIDGTTDVYERTFFVAEPAYNTSDVTRISVPDFANITNVISVVGTFIRKTGNGELYYIIDGREDSLTTIPCKGFVRVECPDGSNYGLAYLLRVESSESAKNLNVTIRYTKASE